MADIFFRQGAIIDEDVIDVSDEVAIVEESFPEEEGLPVGRIKVPGTGSSRRKSPFSKNVMFWVTSSYDIHV